jgi:hypothetical protein
MKDSKKYADKLQKTIRALKRKYGKVEKPQYDLSAEPLVFAVLSEHMSESAAAGNVKKLKDSFVDWNDLRVSRPEEISEVLGKDTAENRQIAEELTANLFAIFNKYDLVNFESLAEVGKRQVKAVLEKLLPASRYVINYLFLTVFDGHAVPLSPAMIEYLKANELIHPESTPEEIEGFMERQVPANQAYESYALLRKETEATIKKPSAEKAKNSNSNAKAAAKKQ